jgi:rubrerythrin
MFGNKKIWRCTVCNDIHIGMEPPKDCPTCHQIDAYVEISEKELREFIK